MDIFGTAQLVLTVGILAIIYYRMIKREVPTQISLLQAIVPIIGGMIAYRFIMVAYLKVALNWIAPIIGPISGLAGSFAKSFCVAAIPEEVAKGLMMAVTLFLFRKRVRNVYEYILIGAAVGLGFTIVEDWGYMTDGANPLRVAFLCGHSVFNMIMGMYIGTARYKKEHNQGPVTMDYVKALCIPILWHGIFDAFTTCNPAFEHLPELGKIDYVYIGIAFAIGLVSIVLQVMILLRTKKDCEKYCAMTFAPQD